MGPTQHLFPGMYAKRQNYIGFSARAPTATLPPPNPHSLRVIFPISHSRLKFGNCFSKFWRANSPFKIPPFSLKCQNPSFLSPFSLPYTHSHPIFPPLFPSPPSASAVSPFSINFLPFSSSPPWLRRRCFKGIFIPIVCFYFVFFWFLFVNRWCFHVFCYLALLFFPFSRVCMFSSFSFGG